MDVGGTRPWMVEGRTMQELLSRVTQGAVTEHWVEENAKHINL